MPARFDPGAMPASRSMMSFVSALIIQLLSNQRHVRCRGFCPSKCRSHFLRDQFDRSQDIGMRRVDRMDLKDQIGYPIQRAVGTKRGNDLVRRPDMRVE